jgi:xanthine dehydrogenase accessory factor
VPEDRDVLQTAASLAESGEAFVLITVVKTQGSTPRDHGAKMIWRPGPGPESDGLIGTVGGGQFEMLVLDAARTHYEKKSCGLEHYILGADADQCCGGTMDVFFEFHGARRRLVIFGAGHVSQALAELVSASALEVVIVDDRPQWNSTERFPLARRIGSWDAGVDAAISEPQTTLACVMSCSHDTDFELLRKLLKNPPAFVGLIGSRSKRVCLFGRLVASGIDEKVVQRVHCPIGVGDTGKEPRLVAISMAAQLLIEAKKLGAPADGR